MDEIEALRAADERLETARERVAEFGEAELRRLAEAYEEFTGLLDRHEESATGDGDFQEFIEFQGTMETTVERLPEDLLLRETFEECDDYLQQRRLTESDFEHVREQLSPVADLVGRLDERREAREAYRRARARGTEKRRELRERISDLERLRRLGEADPDAPVERLRDPIETYNAAVGDAFREFRSSAPARAVLEVIGRAEAYPLVEFAAPPAALRSYLESHALGEEPIPKLLEYAGYSRSKLDHYVDDVNAFTRAVGGNETYLRRLDADALQVEWPPPPAGDLRLRCREYQTVVTGFAPEVVADLRRVRRLPHDTDYDHLRESAVAAADLTEDEIDRLQSGDIEAEQQSARENLEALESALETYEGP